MSSELLPTLRITLLFASGWLVCLPTALAQPAIVELPPDDSPRVTPIVKLVRKTLPAAVAIEAFRPGEKEGEIVFGHGSGTVIHPAGYILTNSHVISGAEKGMVAFFNKPWQPYRVVFNFPSEDLAIIKIDSKEKLTALPLGRSHDIMLGEPVIAIGSPDGLVHSVSEGIVSGVGRATHTEHAHLPSMVQTTAAISGGSSGGPLINAEGELIGVITSRKDGAENVGFAILVDRIREVLPDLIAAELRYGFSLGLKLDPHTSEGRVASITADSPAAGSGIQARDVVTAVDGFPVKTAIDFQLALADREPGDELEIEFLGRTKPEKTKLTLAKLPIPQPQDVQSGQLSQGVGYQLYRGRWNSLPDFGSLEPESKGQVDRPTLTLAGDNKDNFALVFDGLLQIPAEGLYTFYVSSDDGSRLHLAGQSLIENDGLHSQIERGGVIRLAKGAYPFRLEYFDREGEESLKFSVEGPDLPKRAVPKKWFVRQ